MLTKATIIIPNYNGLKVYGANASRALNAQTYAEISEIAGGGQRLDGRKRGVAEGTSRFHTIFLPRTTRDFPARSMWESRRQTHRM